MDGLVEAAEIIMLHTGAMREKTAERAECLFILSKTAGDSRAKNCLLNLICFIFFLPVLQIW